MTFEERHDRDGCLSFVYWVDCPDYFSDLNACHEMEKTLRNQFTTIEESYWRNLAHVQPHPIYATASQRAEAFGKTMNLW